MGFLASGALGGISQFPATLSLTGKRVSEESCSHSGFCLFTDRGGGGLLWGSLCVCFSFQSLLLGSVAVCSLAAVKLQVTFKLNFWVLPVWGSATEYVLPISYFQGGHNGGRQGNNWNGARYPHPMLCLKEWHTYASRSQASPPAPQTVVWIC